MPFTFPPLQRDVPAIEAAVETAKADLRFNDKLCNHLLVVLSRFGFGDKRVAARPFILSHVADRLNSEIRRIMLAPNTDPVSHPFYQERSPREYHGNLERYNVSLFNEARSEFSDYARAICDRIYTDPTALALKPAAITNLLHCALWHSCAYFIDPAKQAELTRSFTRHAW